MTGYLVSLLVRLTALAILIWYAVHGQAWAQYVLYGLIVVAIELLNLTSPSLSSDMIRQVHGRRR